MADFEKAEKTYQQLFEKISRIHETGKDSQLSAYWETGKYLEELKQAFPQRAGYGKKYIERMAGDLTEKYGKGFSVTTLKDMRSLYQEYPKSLPADFLDWTKVILLLRIKDSGARKELTQKALEEKLTRKELQSLIDLYQLKNGERENFEEYLPAERGNLFLYKRVDSEAETGKTITIDCGFNVWRTVTVENSRKLKKSILFTTEKRNEKYFLKDVIENISIERRKFFTYKAQVERVIDGDTLWLQIDIGFDTTVRQKIRLRGIDTPEISFNEGIKAKEFVQRQLKQCPFVIIKTYKTDKYDRYIGDLFYLKGEEDSDTICREGILLNREIVVRGYGRKV